MLLKRSQRHHGPAGEGMRSSVGGREKIGIHAVQALAGASWTRRGHVLLLELAHTASTAPTCLTTRRWNTWSLDYQHCAELLDNTTTLGNMGASEHWNIWTGPISCYAVETAPEVRRPRGPSTQAGRHRPGEGPCSAEIEAVMWLGIRKVKAMQGIA